MQFSCMIRTNYGPVDTNESSSRCEVILQRYYLTLLLELDGYFICIHEIDMTASQFGVMNNYVILHYVATPHSRSSTSFLQPNVTPLLRKYATLIKLPELSPSISFPVPPWRNLAVLYELHAACQSAGRQQVNHELLILEQ
ncbi:hypothetical protein WA026_016847 [Henosepilachna vigintioctopunctata]|uniref:Uncharacterized protein n=1 Tax=Henosepilachna vigintioctopunctata TaxID=420089 RepID=A0AAW1U8V7_9CUCU